MNNKNEQKSMNKRHNFLVIFLDWALDIQIKSLCGIMRWLGLKDGYYDMYSTHIFAAEASGGIKFNVSFEV